MMMPLPQLLDGLGRGQLDVVEKALTLHHRAFRVEFLKHLSVGATVFIDEHVSKMAVLFETILNHSKKNLRKFPFAQNVLKITIDHIYVLQQELKTVKVSSNFSSGQQKKAVSELLDFHANHLEKLYQESSSARGSAVESTSQPRKKHESTPFSSTSNPLKSTLSSKSDEEVVRNALLSSDAVHCAEEILLSRGEKNSTQVAEFIKSVANVYIMELLLKKQIEIAKDVLRNTDQDIWSTLKAMCVNTDNSNIRDYLALELNTISLLEPAEIEAWKFLILVEGIIKKADLKIAVKGQILTVMKKIDGEENVFDTLSVAVLLSLPGIARVSLLMELYFETLNGTLEPMLDKDECWNFLLSRDRVEILIKWINVSVSKNIEPSKPDRLIAFLSSWDITQEMINLIPQSCCSPSTKECLLDCLSLYERYTTEESSNLQKLLTRSIHTSRIFEKLEGKIEHYFVEFCCKNNLPDLLVSCDIDVKIDRHPNAWLELYCKYKALSRAEGLKSSLHEAIELSADFLNIPKFQNHWVDLASYLLSDKTLCESLMGGDEENEDKDNILSEILKRHPQLLNILMKTEYEHVAIDVSLQQLLRGKYSSNPSLPVLRQQSFCRLFKDDPDEPLVDFCHEPMILSHGHIENLDFLYYLKQRRPCFAAMLVLSEVIHNFGKPSRKLFRKASLSAHELAFDHISDQRITSSCIAFLEMLGETSLTLRTHIAAVNNVMAYYNNGRPGTIGFKNNCVPPWNNSFSKEGALGLQEIFELLCSYLPLQIHDQGLAVQLARLHKMPLPQGFLVHCAKKNDWISFLLFCQIYSYPLDVVKTCARQFKSITLRRHLQSFLSSDFIRTKPGSRPSLDANFCKYHKPTVTSSTSQVGDGPVPKALVSSYLEDDLFGVLLACHDWPEPAEALLHACIELPCPILAVLADFYKANVEAQFLSWLISWFPAAERANFECWQKNTAWPKDLVEGILLRSLEISHCNLLSAFKVFLPEHPLVLVMEILVGISNRNFSCHVDDLIEFKKLSLELDNEDKTGEGSWSLSSATFVYDIGIKLFLKFIECSQSAKETLIVLHVLCESKISISVKGSAFDPSKLHDVLEILGSTGVQINFKNFFDNDSEEIHECIRKLMALKLYKEAVKVASVALVNEDILLQAECVVLQQTDRFQQWLDTKYQDFKTFCLECNSCFEHAKVDPMAAFTFYHTCASDLQRNEDRWRALHFAVKWLLQTDASSHQREVAAQMKQVEVEMWQCCMCRKDQSLLTTLLEDLEPSPVGKMCTEALEIVNFIFTEGYHLCGISCEEEPCPVKLIGILLDIGDILSASHVKNLFRSTHQDLEILETCIGLAEEKLNLQDVPTHWSSVASLSLDANVNQNNSKNFRSKKQKSSLNQSLDSSDSPSNKNKEVLSMIQELCKRLKHGRKIGKQIVCCYRLAINLDLSYKEVISVTDPLKLLRTAISQGYFSDYSIASDIMTALRLSPFECAKFLSCEIIAAISKSQSQGNLKEFLLWGHDMEQNLPHLLKMVPDPTLLGNELMKMISKLSITEKSTPEAVLNTAVELLVRAHDCYATSCHMEGVSQVLRTVSKFSFILKTRSEWALMVRLLTGIQRYTEMNYIFKILKENDQFEFLLRKDSLKTLGFKQALLDWLRRECPHEIALLKMTVAHFKMHKEEAELWQKEGLECLTDLVKNGLINDQKTKLSLQTALQDFSHASECYLHADLLNHAMASAHKAELIALQMHLLTQADQLVLQVILLDSKSVSKLIVSTLSFDQALIVARAYNHRTDWAAALFYHCISPGLSTEEYFSAWSSCMELTPALVQNIAFRFQRISGVTREMTANMRWLLGHVQDMDVRYKIASELGFKDMVESLLQAPEVAYLKDTVWQSGFKR